MKTLGSLVSLVLLSLVVLALGVLALFAPTAHASPGIIRVTQDATAAWPCGGNTDWSNPCPLQTALANAASGDELWVASGTYTPATAGLSDPRDATFTMTAGVALYGGFAGNESARNARDFSANVTVLSGDIDGNDSQKPIITNLNTVTGNTTNSYHVVTAPSGILGTAVLDGFTVTGGYAADFGGGMINSGSPTLGNVTFSGNSAIDGGGGMLNQSGSPALTNVTLSNNYGWNGGGFLNDGGSPSLVDVTFTHSVAGNGGGMLNRGDGSPTLAGVIFSSNSASNMGGGMNNVTGNPALTNVTFTSNSAAWDGGGMFNGQGNPVLANVTFTSNSATDEPGFGGGMFNEFGSPTLTNITFASNTATHSPNGAGGGMFSNDGSPALTNVTFTSNSALYGGGMVSRNGGPTLTNVTFYSNSALGTEGLAGGVGGGMYNESGSPTLTNVTFTQNRATGPVAKGGGMYIESGSPTLYNTILWDNTASSGTQVFRFGGTVTISYSVVEGDCPSEVTCSTTPITADARLGALGDWGGSTQTVRLLPDSSAIGKGNEAVCPSADQRGRPRLWGCDIGAFEFQGYTLAKTGGDPQTTPITLAFDQPLQVTLRETDTFTPVVGIPVTFTAPSSGASATWGASFSQAATTNASGIATVPAPVANGVLGSFEISATTWVDPPRVPASAVFFLTNTKVNTTTSLASSPNPSTAGGSVVFTVTVSAVAPASGIPTGTVELYEMNSLTAPARAPQKALSSKALVNGIATFSVSSFAVGTHTLRAAYGGDTQYNASTSSTLSHVVREIVTPTFKLNLPLLRR